MGVNVSLTRELEKYVESKVASGMYTSASEVVREGLRLMVHLDTLTEARREELRQQISDGLAQAKAGKVVHGGKVFGALIVKKSAKRKKA
jgi:antitoxin ParD1/3/4